MSIFGRNLIRSSLFRISNLNAKQSLRLISRNLIVLTNNKGHSDTKHSLMCSCGCNGRGIHTSGDKELMNFLDSEISSEKDSLPSISNSLADFSVKTNEAELTLSKRFHNEDITIAININHSTTGGEPETEQAEEISCQPNFEVDIKVGSKTLSLTCEYVEATENESDVFGISELTIYEGEFEDKTYCLSGDIMDPMMYDLLMNMLEERGITNSFAEQLQDYCSAYDQKCYVDLLQKIKNFVHIK